MFGDYFVYAFFPRATNQSTAVPVSIYEKSGTLLAKVSLNEKGTSGEGKVLLGKFKLHSGTLSSVVISNKGTTGEVIADAIQFLPAAAVSAPATAAVKTKAVTAAVETATASKTEKPAASSALLDEIVE